MKENKEKQINLRLTLSEFEQLEEIALSKKITKSELILNLVFDKKVSKQVGRDLIKVIQSQNKIGNNLNQIARTLNTAKLENVLNIIDYKNLIDKLEIIENQLENIYKECRK